MKKNKLLLISFLLAASLASCSTGNKENHYSFEKADPELQEVINSLKGVSHTANISYDIYVNQVDPDAIDTFFGTSSERTYSYSKEEGRGYRDRTIRTAIDLEKGTHNFVTDANGDPLKTVYDNGERLYFRDEKTGVIVAEYLGADNEVQSFLQSDYDYESGTYIPISFDSEFRNPFDYIQPRDIKKVANNEYELSLDKASFALECYGSAAAMAVVGSTITTNDKHQITSLHFEMGMEGGEGDTYTRTTTFDLEYSKFGKESELAHIKPCENSNPRLQAALNSLNGVTNYKYSKDYINEDGSVKDHIMGYFTEDVAFFHHDDSPDDTSVYTREDDYDYLAVICNANKKYYGYEFTYNANTDSYYPALIMLSSSAAYAIDTFSGLGPNLGVISASIFSLKEGTDNVYIVENDVLRTSIASYFDFQFLGVNSQVLETRTSDFELELHENGSMTINTGYAYSEYGRVVEQKIIFNLDVSTFNNTTIPSYVEIPDTTGNERF